MMKVSARAKKISSKYLALQSAAISSFFGKEVHKYGKSSEVNTLPKAKSKTRSKQNKDMHKCRRVYSERGVPLPVLTSGGE
jgi:hypothetical protein